MEGEPISFRKRVEAIKGRRQNAAVLSTRARHEGWDTLKPNEQRELLAAKGPKGVSKIGLNLPNPDGPQAG